MRTVDVVIYREGRSWVAQALNVDVSSFGESLEEARGAIRAALELYFEDEDSPEVHEASDVRLEQLIV